MARSPAHSSTSSDDFSDADPPQPASAAVVQTVNIRSHVPVLLDFDDSNYTQWRCFFDSVLGKFGLEDHVKAPTPLAQRTAEWRMIDHCLVNWIYTTVSKPVFDIIHKPRVTAFSLWSDVEGQFRDNELERAVILEAEFRSLKQGDMSIRQYCTTLKRLADNLCDLGHSVSEPSQVLNPLRGLNPKYRHVKPVIKSKSPPHTFASACSYLLLEEVSDDHDAKMEAGLALVAGHSASSAGGSSSTTAGSVDAASGSGGQRPKHKKKQRGRGSGPVPGTFPNNAAGAQQPRPPMSTPWTAGYNPWTGLVQAWPMPFRAPGAGVLGPRPPFQPQQAMIAHQGLPPPTGSSTPSWDHQALYSALSSADVTTQPPPSAVEWYMDTGASTHMSSSPGSSNPNGEALM